MSILPDELLLKLIENDVAHNSWVRSIERLCGGDTSLHSWDVPLERVILKAAGIPLNPETGEFPEGMESMGNFAVDGLCDMKDLSEIPNFLSDLKEHVAYWTKECDSQGILYVRAPLDDLLIEILQAQSRWDQLVDDLSKQKVTIDRDYPDLLFVVLDALGVPPESNQTGRDEYMTRHWDFIKEGSEEECKAYIEWVRSRLEAWKLAQF